MPRGLSESTRNLLANNSLQMATFMKMFFTTNGLNFTDYGQACSANIGYGLEVFTPDDFWLEYGSSSESSKLQVGEISVVLSTADTGRSFLAYALDGSYLNTKVHIARAFMNGTIVVGSPFTFFEGRIKGFEFDEDNQESTITFDLASHWSDFEKVNCRRTNANSQKRYFPDDSVFNWSHETSNTIRWGRK